MDTLEQIRLLEQWKEARRMVQESQAPGASSWEHTRLARRVEWATELGRKCLKAGLLPLMGGTP